MPELSELSPAVRQILEDNHFEPIRLLRYGPRFVCCVVLYNDQECLFKLVLPESERDPIKPHDQKWTIHDSTPYLERRLLKEAMFLQFFSQELGVDGFEPQMIAIAEASPVWSLRSFINARTMAAWDSDFVFSPRFFETFTPRQCIDFFVRLHELSAILPHSLSDQISDYASTLTNPDRFDRSIARAKQIPEFRAHADHLAKRFVEVSPEYQHYDKVITHYEPYPPHIFSQDGKFGLIDWENVGWGHRMQDLSVLWMRCMARPDWQQEYIDILEEYGYFEGNGRLFWESELLIQSFANHLFFSEGGPIGTPEYDAKAVEFFANNVRQILANSQYFKV